MYLDGLTANLPQLPLDTVIERKDNLQSFDDIFDKTDSLTADINFLWGHHALCKHQAKAIVPLPVEITEGGRLNDCPNCSWCKLEELLQIPKEVRTKNRRRLDTPDEKGFIRSWTDKQKRNTISREQRGFCCEIVVSQRTGAMAAYPRKMIPHLPDSSHSPAVTKLLHETQIPRRQTAHGHPRPSKQTASLRIVNPMDLSRDLITQGVAKTEVASPTMSHAMMTTPLVQLAAKPAVPSSSKTSNEPRVYTSSYVTVAPYRKTPDSKAHIVKKCAKKVKTCLINVGDKLLTGLEAVWNFYAYSGQKWESKYQPFERMISNNSVWEADKAVLLEKAEKSQQKSWGKRWQKYWRPDTADQLGESSTLAHGNREEAKKEAARIPPISTCLGKKNKQRPERIQSSHLPNFPLGRGRTQERNRRVLLTRQPHFSSPRGRMHSLERQHGHAHQYERQLSVTPELRARENEDGDEDLGTPWSGLATIAEEHFFGEEVWEDAERMRDDKGIGEGEGKREGDKERDCDGLEAGGEFCLRHESCAREAMAIGGA